MHAITAYRRVSTADQGRSGLGLEAQASAIERFACLSSATVLADFVDVDSGTVDERRELLAAIAHANRSKSVLVVATLDRLSRDVAFIATLMKRGVDFRCADMPSASTFELHIRAAISEEERRKISQRTRNALRVAKSRGKVLGGYRGTPPTDAARAKAKATMRDGANAFAATVAPLLAELLATGHRTLAARAEALNARHIAAPRGGKWTAMQVRRVEARVA